MNKINLSSQQVEDLARPFVSMVDRIKAFYEDPKNERDFQEFFAKIIACFLNWL